jgi:hypothetical protein
MLENSPLMPPNCRRVDQVIMRIRRVADILSAAARRAALEIAQLRNEPGMIEQLGAAALVRPSSSARVSN